MNANPDEKDAIESAYIDAYLQLKRTTEFGKTISHNCSNNEWEERYSMAASLLFSACMASESLLNFLPERPEGRVDHYSAANSCRMILEHCIMLCYVAEDGLSIDEIDLRLLLLHLHDASARYRLFKGLEHPSGDVLEKDIHLALLKGAIDQAKSKLRENKIFKSFNQD